MIFPFGNSFSTSGAGFLTVPIFEINASNEVRGRGF